MTILYKPCNLLHKLLLQLWACRWAKSSVLPGALCFPAPRNPGIRSQANTREHCQMASSHHACPVTPEECDCVPFVRLSSHSLARPTLADGPLTFQGLITVNPITPSPHHRNATHSPKPSGTCKAVQPRRLNFLNKGYRSLTQNLQKYLFAGIISKGYKLMYNISSSAI